MATSAPSRAKARATARPIPLSAPVMSAWRPFSQQYGTSPCRRIADLERTGARHRRAFWSLVSFYAKRLRSVPLQSRTRSTTSRIAPRDPENAVNYRLTILARAASGSGHDDRVAFRCQHYLQSAGLGQEPCVIRLYGMGVYARALACTQEIREYFAACARLIRSPRRGSRSPRPRRV